MQWWVVLLGLIGLSVFIITPLIMEVLSELGEAKMLEKYKEIVELKDNGICNSCSYGYDKCVSDGKPYCKYGCNKKEDKDGQEKLI